MIKVVNPLFRSEETKDAAFRCRCVCYSNDNHSSTETGSWVPFTENNCSCYANNPDNKSANYKCAQGNDQC